jgi:hypothetical protein
MMCKRLSSVYRASSTIGRFVAVADTMTAVASSDFTGLNKVVDKPQANRMLTRRIGSRESSPIRDMGIFGGAPESQPRIASHGRRGSIDYSRSNSKTSIFGSEDPALGAKPHGLRAFTPPRSAPLLKDAVPGEADYSTSHHSASYRAGRRHIPLFKQDSVLTQESFRPLRPDEKPDIMCVKDNYSHRPHSAHHGRAHLASENRRSVLFNGSGTSPTVAAENGSNGGHVDPTVMARYDNRYVRAPTTMQRFECRPEAVNRVGIAEQEVVSGTGKRLTHSSESTLVGILSEDRNVRAVDRSYRPTPPWR